MSAATTDGARSRLWRRILDLPNDHGPVTVLALLRLGLIPLLWSRFGEAFQFFRNVTPYKPWLSLAFYLGTFCWFVGYRSKIAGWVTVASLGVGTWYLGTQHGHRDFLHHHAFLLLFFAACLAIGPAGQRLSVDQWLSARRGEPTPLEGPLAALWLWRLQVFAVYFYGALDKTQGAWFTGARMTQYGISFWTGSDWSDSALWDALMLVSGIGTVVVEYFIPVGLFFARTRLLAIVLGVLLHGSIYMTLPVFTFSMTMMLGYVAFFEPAGVQRCLERLVKPD